MCIFMSMGGNSTTWMNTAVLVTSMCNFSENRGPVSGILKGYNGLSTAILTNLCSALFSDSPSSFLLMLSIVPFLVCLAAMLFLREADLADADDEDEVRYFYGFNAIAFVIAVFLFVFDVSGEHGRAVSRAFAVVLLVLMAVPVVVPISAGWKAKRVTDLKPGPEPVGIRAQHLNKGEGGSVEEKVKRRRSVKERTIVEEFSTVEFWILLVSFLCGVGTGLAVINNMEQIGLALGHVDVSMFVKLTRIFGFIGRIGSGSISEYLIKKSGTPRPRWNAISQILMAVGYVIMALALPGSLYVGSIIVGLCHGAHLAVSVTMASEFFGRKNFGLIYNILPLGSFLFSGLLAGFLYDAQATRTHGGGNTCVGAHCYRLVFVIMALVCLVGFGLDLVLAFRTTSLYSKIQMSKKSKKASTKAEAIKS